MSFLREKVEAMGDDEVLSEADNLRLHRAHRIAWIIGGEGTNSLCFRMDHLSTEYAGKYLRR